MDSDWQYGAQIALFQFQTGSIKSIPPVATSLLRVRFQFQTGSIKSPGTATNLQAAAQEFQFQTGSIKSREGVDGVFFFACFNSKLVRLKALLGSHHRRVYTQVSIPNWFD